ncbi:hypothetical protein BDU57DRAFT_449188, partial [Ampelomyces quisqualis]
DVYFYGCDVTDISAVTDLFQEIRQAYGESTALISNAGSGINDWKDGARRRY